MNNYSIDILQSELDKFTKAKEKSIKFYKNKSIDKKLHKTHLSNLNPKIDNLKKSINILNETK